MASLVPLIIGIVIFLAVHGLSRMTDLREKLIAQHGEALFKGLYSVASLLGLALIVYGYGVYRAAGYIPVWTPPKGMAHLAILLVWPAMILLVATYARGRISARAKHPMLLAIKIWAFAHLIANGDLGSILLFGSFLVWGVFARIRLKRAGDFGHPEAAMAPDASRNDIIAIAAGTAITLALVFGLHRWLIGVAILPV